MDPRCDTDCIYQPDETHIAAGMADGTLSVRRRQPKATESTAYEQALAVAQAGAYDSLLTGVLPKIGQGITKGKGKARPEGDVEEYKVEARRKQQLRHYDRYLKSFKYSAALDAVLKKVGFRRLLRWLDSTLTYREQTVPPSTSFSLIQELIHRDGLRSALAGRDDVLLEPVLRLLLKYVADPRFGVLVCDVATLVTGASLDLPIESILIGAAQTCTSRCSVSHRSLIPCLPTCTRR